MSTIKTLGPKIAFGGPSGSGKTTLANYIKELDPSIRQVQSYETRQFPENKKETWKKIYGYSGDIGHQALINLQNKYPIFGMDWQLECLKSRGEVIKNENSTIFVRDCIAVFDGKGWRSTIPSCSS